jgi:hypothetical protein
MFIKINSIGFIAPLPEFYNSPKINIIYGLRKCLLTLRYIDLVGLHSGFAFRNTDRTLPKRLLMYLYFNFLSKVNKIFYLTRFLICFERKVMRHLRSPHDEILLIFNVHTSHSWGTSGMLALAVVIISVCASWGLLKFITIKYLLFNFCLYLQNIRNQKL